MEYTEDTYFIRVLEVEEKKEEGTHFFALQCEKKFPVLLQGGDILEVETESEQVFFVSVRKSEETQLELFMSRQYEKDILGLTTFRMAFSPLKSIEGADKILAVSQVFPPCHYEKIRTYARSGDKASMMINLDHSFQRILKLDFEGIVEGDFVEWEEINEILQLGFRDRGHKIEVDIHATQGLHGRILCEKVKAGWIMPARKRKE